MHTLHSIQDGLSCCDLAFHVLKSQVIQCGLRLCPRTKGTLTEKAHFGKEH